MMFKVIWDNEARAELHRIWVLATDSLAVREASEEAERILSIDPVGAGRILKEDLWKVLLPPIAIYYSIDPSERTIVIENVAHTA